MGKIPLKISAIAACDLQMTIGSEGGMPWDLPADMRHFVRTTRNKPIIMGRRTFDSLPGPLKGRLNIVLTRQADFDAPAGVRVARSIEESLEIARESAPDEVMVIGGAGIYAQFIPRCDRIYLTVIQAKFEDGDTFFPAIDLDEWDIVSRDAHPADAKNAYAYRFFTLDRAAPGALQARHLQAAQPLPEALQA